MLVLLLFKCALTYMDDLQVSVSGEKERKRDRERERE